MEYPDAPDAAGDDVHEAQTTGDAPMYPQVRGPYLEVALLEHGEQWDDRRVAGVILERQGDSFGRWQL